MHMQKHPQVQAIKHVADFVYDHDHQRHLPIVYHAGHGIIQPGSDGRLMLAGRLIRDDKHREMSIDWTQVEPALAKARADVLLVFDVCYAGLLSRPSTRGARKAFQYIAACTATQLTRSAGVHSFSAAIVWAFANLADSVGFSVSKLVETLVQYEHFPRDTQHPGVYGSRYGPVDRDIWIAPAAKTTTGKTLATGEDQAADDVPSADVLDVRLHFADHATEAVVGNTARALKKFLLQENLPFHRIDFLRYKSFVEGPARRWLEKVQKKKSKSTGKETGVAGALESPAVDLKISGGDGVADKILDGIEMWSMRS